MFWTRCKFDPIFAYAECFPSSNDFDLFVAHRLHIVINDPKTHDLLHHVVCCISNLCTELPSLSEDKMSLLITAMVMVLRHDLPTEIWANSVRVLGCLSDANDYLKKAIVETGITKELVQLLVEKNSTLLYEALKCIGNLVAGLDAQEAVGARILPRIHPIMVSNQVCDTIQYQTTTFIFEYLQMAHPSPFRDQLSYSVSSPKRHVRLSQTLLLVGRNKSPVSF